MSTENISLFFRIIYNEIVVYRAAGSWTDSKGLSIISSKFLGASASIPRNWWVMGREDNPYRLPIGGVSITEVQIQVSPPWLVYASSS